MEQNFISDYIDTKHFEGILINNFVLELSYSGCENDDNDDDEFEVTITNNDRYRTSFHVPKLV